MLPTSALTPSTYLLKIFLRPMDRPPKLSARLSINICTRMLWLQDTDIVITTLHVQYVLFFYILDKTIILVKY